MNLTEFGSHWIGGQSKRVYPSTMLYWGYKVRKHLRRILASRDTESFESIILDIDRITRNQPNAINTNSFMLSFYDVMFYLTDFERMRPFWNEIIASVTRMRHAVEFQDYYSSIISPSTKTDSAIQTMLYRQMKEDDFVVFRTAREYSVYRRYMNIGNYDYCMLAADPTADVDIIGLAVVLEFADWKMLVDRVDIMCNDYNSWKAVQIFVERFSGQSKSDMKLLVSSYWPYMLYDSADKRVSKIRERVFKALSICPINIIV